MRSATLVFIVLIGMIGCAFALPAPILPVEESELAAQLEFDGEHDVLQGEAHSRHKRATCDLLSGFGVEDSACAAHCIGLGKRGGYCDDKKVCRCR